MWVSFPRYEETKNLVKEIRESKEIGNLRGLLGKDLGEKFYVLLDIIEDNEI